MAKAINLDHISTLWGKMKEYVSTAISGLYTKPTTGVPKTDLATDVQTSLGKADSALQSHQTLKTINNQSIVGSGNITIEGGSSKAASITTEEATSNAYRDVFFALEGDKTKVVYDDDFQYNPATNTLKVGSGTLSPTNYSGNASTATKLGSVTVGSANRPIYLNAGTPAVASVGEGFLAWGGTNWAGTISPIGVAMSQEHSANRIAFINGNALYIEYATDGENYTEYNLDSANKTMLCTSSYGIYVGRASGEYEIGSKTRITLTAQTGTTCYVHTSPKKMLINISSSGGMTVLVETRTGTNYQNNGAWTTFGTYTLSGWSGWNDIPLILGTLGGASTQLSNNWQLRLTFTMTSKSANYPTIAQVNSIRIFGDNAWTPTSSMGATGHLYSYDYAQNATFPAKVTATSIVKSGGTSAQFLKADGSVDSNTYLTSHQSLSNYYTKTEVNNLVNATGTSMPAGGFLPNVEYDLGTLSEATTFKLSSSTGKFFWTFNTGTTAPTITWSFTAKWANAPVINASKHYEVSVRNGYAYIQEFDI